MTKSYNWDLINFIQDKTKQKLAIKTTYYVKLGKQINSIHYSLLMTYMNSNSLYQKSISFISSDLLLWF